MIKIIYWIISFKKDIRNIEIIFDIFELIISYIPFLYHFK